MRKSVLLHLLEGSDKGHTTEGYKEKKKSQHQAGIKPITSRVLLCGRVLYHSAPAAAQEKTNIKLGNG